MHKSFTHSIMQATSPFDILGNKETNKVETTLGIEGETTFSLTDIAVLFKATILYGGIVLTIAAAIALLFIRNNDKIVKEKKDRITHIILIIWLAGSAPTLFNILKSFFDGLFGF